MEIHQSAELDAPLSEVWKALNDPNILKLCVPGCQEIKVIDENTYSAKAVIKVGFITSKFDNIHVKKVNSVENELLVFEMVGEDTNRIGSVRQVLEIKMSGDGSTNPPKSHLEINATIDLKGKFATLGKRIVEWKAKEMTADFAKNLRNSLM